LDESEVVGEEPVQPSDSEREKEADAADGEEDAAASDQSEDAEDAASTGAPENEAPVGVSLPELISRVEADYPPEAAAQGLEAKVILELTIDVDGRVLDATVREPAGLGSTKPLARRPWGFASNRLVVAKKPSRSAYSMSTDSDLHLPKGGRKRRPHPGPPTDGDPG
jgi:hypothetical protein